MLLGVTQKSLRSRHLAPIGFWPMLNYEGDIYGFVFGLFMEFGFSFSKKLSWNPSRCIKKVELISFGQKINNKFDLN